MWLVCASQARPPRKRAKLGQVPAGAPLERIAVDIMGPLPKTGNGNEYIVVIGDYFTKWTEAFALMNHTAQTVADVIVQEFVGRFGVPRLIHSDQGREFESLLISHLCQLLHIKKTRTIAYNPKSDGMVERANRTVKQMLSVLVNKAQDNWDDHLPYIMMAYQASVNEGTKCTPNLLMLNRETNLPVDLMFGSPPGPTTCPNAYVEWVRQASEHAFEFVQRQLHTSTERQKTLYDRNSGTPKCQVGQTVWRYYPPRAKRKFGRGWIGPYLVVGKVNGLCYIIQKSLRSNGLVVHVDHLKKCEGVRPIQNWLAETVDNGEVPHRVEVEGPSSSGPQMKLTQPLEESSSDTLLDQAEEMTGLPQPLLAVTDEIADEPGSHASGPEEEEKTIEGDRDDWEVVMAQLKRA